VFLAVHVALAIVWLAAAIPSPSSVQIGLAFAGLATVFAPPLLANVKLSGYAMQLISYGAALVIALVALYLAGDLSISGTGAVTLAGGWLSVWGVMQAVYGALKARWPQLVGLPASPAFPPAPPTPAKTSTT